MLAALVLAAGCVGGISSGAGPAATDNTTTPDDPATETPTTECGNSSIGVSFYGLDAPEEADIWQSDSLTVGYRAPGNVTLLFVAYVDGERAGTASAGPYEYPIVADGDRIPVGRDLSGNHTVRVAVFEDANGNGEYDPSTDPACTEDGERVGTDNRTIDFDRFDDGDDGTSTSDDSKEPRETTTT